MGTLRDLWRHPRQAPLRRAVFQIHLWAGLVLGLYMGAMSLTGVVLLFADELEEVWQPEIYRAAPPPAARAPVRDLLSSANAAYPDGSVTALYAPTRHRETVVVYLRKGGEVLYAYLHPQTGRVQAQTTPSTSPVRWLREFHFNLLSGRTGRAVNGIGGLALLLLAVTGLFLWWPGVRKWMGRLSLHPRGNNWRLLNWELHSVAGFWSAALLSIWALTGFYFGHAATVNAAINRISPLSQVEAPLSKGSGSTRPADVQALVDEAVRRSPSGYFYGVQMPANSRSAYIVFMSRVPDGEKRHCDYHYFDQYTGAHLGVWRRGVAASAGDAIVASVVPLHFGTFGGWPVKIAWAIFGLAPLLLFVTGALMWWTRRQKHSQKSGPAPAFTSQRPVPTRR